MGTGPLTAATCWLTSSGPGTAMGALLRRFWQPALLSRELAKRDGAPKKLRILGEDLLAFRDSQGRVYVGNSGSTIGNSVRIFAANATGNATPIASIFGARLVVSSAARTGELSMIM